MRLENRFSGRFEILDPGELFRRYFYNEKIMALEEIEDMIVRKIENVPDGKAIILHWHYAVRRPSGYTPQISFSRLRKLAENDRVKKAALVLVTASAVNLYERRQKEYSVKKRELYLDDIRDEILTDEKYFNKHHRLFSDVLGSKKVTALKVVNEEISAAESILSVFLSAFLGS